MSLFDWFARKPVANAVDSPQGALSARADATTPLRSSGTFSRGHDAGSTHAANRKAERLERRELLYTVVRNAMARAGMLSSSYKFKVLSLDARGKQYLIMVDIARKDAGAPQRQTEIEGVIAQLAKAQHDILVTAVYWRLHDNAVTSAASKPPPDAMRPRRAAPATPLGYEPLQADEVAAFKRAMAVATAPMPLSAPGEIITSGPRNPVVEDGEESDVERRLSPLSGTQYGELN